MLGHWFIPLFAKATAPIEEPTVITGGSSGRRKTMIAPAYQPIPISTQQRKNRINDAILLAIVLH